MRLEDIRINFLNAKNDTTKLAYAAELARAHLDLHGLRSYPNNWDFKFDHAKNRCGLCRHSKRLIQMSTYYIKSASLADIEDTILHEIAHALCGPAHGHDSTWRAMCLKVGAKPVRCGKTTIVAPSKYIGKCADCGSERKRHKKLSQYSLTFNSYYHPGCKYKQNNGRIIWYQNGKQLNFLTQLKDTVKPTLTVELAAAAQKALEGTGIKVTVPTQTQINDLWARLNKLEGKS